MAETTVVDLLNQFRFADYSEKPPKSELWLNRPLSFTPADAAVYQGSGINVFALGHSAPDYMEGLRFFAKWNGFLSAHSDLLCLRLLRLQQFDRLLPHRINLLAHHLFRSCAKLSPPCLRNRLDSGHLVG
jgi:hypothetical protein